MQCYNLFIMLKHEYYAFNSNSGVRFQIGILQSCTSFLSIGFHCIHQSFHILRLRIVQAAVKVKDIPAAGGANINKAFYFINDSFLRSKVQQIVGKASGNASYITQLPFSCFDIDLFKTIQHFSFRYLFQESKTGVVRPLAEQIRR